MSWLSSAVHGIGHLAEKAAPIVGLIPGVGTLAGGVIGGLGGLAAGDGLGGALKYGLEGAASGFGGGLLKGAGGGAQSIASLAGGGAGGAIPDAALSVAGPAIIGGPAEAAAGGGLSGALSGLAGKAGGFLTGNGGKNALGVAQGIDSILQQRTSNQYAKDALNSVEGSYNQRAPLRAQGIQQLLSSQAGNPYAGKVG